MKNIIYLIITVLIFSCTNNKQDDSNKTSDSLANIIDSEKNNSFDTITVDGIKLKTLL